MTMVIIPGATATMIATVMPVIGTTIPIIVMGTVRVTAIRARRGNAVAIGVIGRSRSWQRRGRDLRRSAANCAGNANKLPRSSATNALNGVNKGVR